MCLYTCIILNTPFAHTTNAQYDISNNYTKHINDVNNKAQYDEFTKANKQIIHAYNKIQFVHTANTQYDRLSNNTKHIKVAKQQSEI